ncbi:MAG: protein translocase subunit SecD [Bacteroidota bacterium]
MRADFRWKLILVIGLFLISAFVLYPPLSVPIARSLGFDDYKGPYGGQPIRQGLDLRGGMELILGPDYRVESSVLDRVADELKNRLAEADVGAPVVDMLGFMELDKYDGLKITLPSAEQARRAVASGAIPDEITLPGAQSEMHLMLKPKQIGKVLEISVEQSPKDFPQDAMERARTIIEERVNRLGLSEPVIQLEKERNRIVVQLPSVTSEKEAEDILQRTGRLNFRIDGRKVLFGDDLKSARAGFDGSEAVIHFQFGPKGAARLKYLTTKYLKQPMEIYLDEEPLMANPGPTIQSVIPDGNGQITLGRGTIEEAKKYAILMESGSLPISLRNLAVNQVSPTLGKEIIHQSLVAGVAGLALVVLFVLALYGFLGLVADLTLVLFAGMTLVVLALLRGVLTLPGVAGFILSVGMAVDANIIIYERIKDELRAGKRMRAAIEGGFSRAFWTIFDSNMTAMITALVLLFYGTSTVRGFAITLITGIVVSIFCALVVTRFLLEIVIDRDPDRFVGYFKA